MATAEWEEDEWELVNDDGFVYKVKKRLRLDPTTAISALPPQYPSAVENLRRERKKRALAKLRERCQKEMVQWELLSNTLWAFQQRAQNQQWQEQTTTEMSCDLDVGSPHPPRDSSESDCRPLLDDLILRAEADEAIIQYASNLCEHEKHMKQSFVDLPVWASPRQLMASLCDE